MFWISVKDDASGPVGKLQKALRSTSRTSKQAWGQLAGGAMTAAGAGLALEGMVSPALDLNRALADVSSLDVDPKGLKLLDATAKQYAMSYGGTAAEFVELFLRDPVRHRGIGRHTACGLHPRLKRAGQGHESGRGHHDQLRWDYVRHLQATGRRAGQVLVD